MKAVEDALPYLIALGALGVFIRLTHGHISHLVHLIFGEVKAVIALNPSRRATNFLGTILLFLITVVVLFDGSFEFLLGRAADAHGSEALRHGLNAALVFLFGASFVVSVKVSGD